VCLLSMFRHLRMLKQLQVGESLYLRSPRLVIGVAVALAILGLVMAGYPDFRQSRCSGSCIYKGGANDGDQRGKRDCADTQLPFRG